MGLYTFLYYTLLCTTAIAKYVCTALTCDASLCAEQQASKYQPFLIRFKAPLTCKQAVAKGEQQATQARQETLQDLHNADENDLKTEEERVQSAVNAKDDSPLAISHSRRRAYDQRQDFQVICNPFDRFHEVGYHLCQNFSNNLQVVRLSLIKGALRGDTAETRIGILDSVGHLGQVGDSTVLIEIPSNVGSF